MKTETENKMKTNEQYATEALNLLHWSGSRHKDVARAGRYKGSEDECAEQITVQWAIDRGLIAAIANRIIDEQDD